MVSVVDATVLPNNKLSGQQNQIDSNHKIKQIPWYQIAGPGPSASFCHTLGMAVSWSPLP